MTGGKGTKWGRKRQRLAELLEAEGYLIDLITVAQGRDRSDFRRDIMRWEAWGKKILKHEPPGYTELANINTWFGSYDTITDCVRYGITLTPEKQYLAGATYSGGFYVGANEPQKPQDALNGKTKQ